MARVFAVVLVLASVACGNSPSLTSPSAGTPTTFVVVDGSGTPLSDIDVCPGDAACVKTSASGRATVSLNGMTSVRFRQHDVTLGGNLFDAGNSHRVVIQ